MLDRGEGGEKDPKEARRLYSLAAKQGDAMAQFNLAIMLDRGEGGDKDPKEARRLFSLGLSRRFGSLCESFTHEC